MDQSRKYSDQSKYSTKAAFKNCAVLHDRIFSDLRHQDLQNVIDGCTLKHSSKELIVSLFHQMYAYADIQEITEKDYSAHVKINTGDDDEHGVAFTEEEMKILWNHKKDPVIEMILIMCYSGYRIKEYKNIEVNLKDRYFCGGIKTSAGKNRIVPVHSGIFDLVEKRMKRDGGMLIITETAFRRNMYEELNRIKIEKHTPHDCRHTFSALCEKYGVNENDRKRMMGHSFGSDITNGTYGHRSAEDLRKEIEKIEVCY